MQMNQQNLHEKEPAGITCKGTSRTYMQRNQQELHAKEPAGITCKGASRNYMQMNQQELHGKEQKMLLKGFLLIFNLCFCNFQNLRRLRPLFSTEVCTKNVERV